MANITNPILKGFHPDPSIIRVDNDYYIATSTFEWWPGVRINHSTDLIHWECIGYALDEERLLDLKGVGASQGIWAPCLTYDNGTFYLLFTVVHSFYCNMYDTQNFLVTSENILGPWSDPIALNSFGFDPSLFHDDDGKKYVVSMVTDHRVPKKYAGRIILQEYSETNQSMVGDYKEIYVGEIIFLEGPHIFKRNGYYYLFAADTGTGEAHGQSILRSKSIWGPYEMYKSDSMCRLSDSEAYSILTTRHNPAYPIQKCGHADLVETPEGEFYAVHLCGRPLDRNNPPDALRFPGHRRYPLGRETALQKMKWTEDDWLILDNETTLPDLSLCIDNNISLQDLAHCIDKSAKSTLSNSSFREYFDGWLSKEWQSQRIPMTSHHLSLTDRPGWLRLFGRQGLASKFDQTLIAKRCTEMSFTVTTKIEFTPHSFKEMAGLILIYDIDNYIYLHLTHDEDLGGCISILTAENKRYKYPIGWLPLNLACPIYLRFEVTDFFVQCLYSTDDQNYITLGEKIDASFLSDEACNEGWFTGSMVGIACQDLTGFANHADFEYFEILPS